MYKNAKKNWLKILKMDIYFMSKMKILNGELKSGFPENTVMTIKQPFMIFY